jgi:hypothetical protein
MRLRTFIRRLFKTIYYVDGTNDVSEAEWKPWQIFGRYRTVKIKLPRSCCPWCRINHEMLEERMRVLEDKVDQQQKGSASKPSLTLLMMTSDTSIKLRSDR